MRSCQNIKEIIFIDYVILRKNKNGKAKIFSKQGSTEGSSDFWPKLSCCNFHLIISKDIVNNVDI